MPKQQDVVASGLNDSQRRFALEYLVDLNGTQAAIRAGYSKKSASQQASDLLANPKVKAEIRKQQSLREARTNVTADRVIAELSRIAFARIDNVCAWDEDRVYYKRSSDLEESDLAAISEISTDETSIPGRRGEEPTTKIKMKVKMHDKVRALELLSKHLGILKENPQSDNDSSVSIRLNYKLED